MRITSLAVVASLVWPDGYVAWRSVDLPVDPVQALTEALGRVSSSALASLRGEKLP